MIEDDSTGEHAAAKRRIITVSNRLPVSITKAHDGRWKIEPGSGGLVTALAPVLRNRGGVWIGWPRIPEGTDVNLEELLAEAARETGYALSPVLLTEEEIRNYYYGFSNEILWPLFHDLQMQTRFKPEYWGAYRRANRKFAEVIARQHGGNDFIWIHDYHLMEVAHHLREMGITSNIAFFLHIPFPPLDIFLKMPWRFQILQALLQYDLIGFQTLRDRRNFVHCAKRLVKHVSIRGRGQIITGRIEDRETRIGTFPISIDFDEFASGAATREVADRAWYLHEDLPGRQIILGVDRLDYTKGIPLRLEAFRNALERYPELRGKVTLIQVVVPSREHVPEYMRLKTEIESLVGEINGQFTGSGWVPVHYIFRHLPRSDLLAYYRTAEIALITPLKDGMNLVAKEFCAASLEENGVLVLSEFAGAAAEMRPGALLVNPHDITGTADALHRAITMDHEERVWRMKKLRKIIRKNNIFHWVDSFLGAAFDQKLKNFDVVEDYIPSFDAAGAHPAGEA